MMEKIKLLALLPKSYLDPFSKSMRMLFDDKLIVYFYRLESLLTDDFKEVNFYFEQFFDICKIADIVILHDWLPQLPIDSFKSEIFPNFSDPGKEYFSTLISAPSKRTFRGQHEMFCLARHIKAINRQASIYSMVFGGAYEAPVHNSAKIIFSFHDPIMLEHSKQAG
ncbi:MAG: hypothetical protein V1865_02715 [bacterium]